MIVITVRCSIPVLASYDIDPILFGVILVIYVELGQISPPIGINCVCHPEHLGWQAGRGRDPELSPFT